MIGGPVTPPGSWIDPPEEGITPEELIARATEMTSALRDEQKQTEARGHYSERMHRRFQDAGFSRVLQPRRFGGYELDVPTFYRIMVAIATGCPSTGWCLGLASSHALVVASHFSEAGQATIFGPDGDFRSPHSVAPSGTAERVDGGWLVNGRWRYCSGIPFATHFMGSALVTDPETGRPGPYTVVVPRASITVLDDWGGESVLGMQGSGSNSVVVEDAVIPECCAVPFRWDGDEPALGAELHGNPMYRGLLRSFYHGTLVCPVVGAAKAALEEYEHLLRNTRTTLPPFGEASPVLRCRSADAQRNHGEAVRLVLSAEQLLYAAGERYMDGVRRWAETGRPYTLRDDVPIWQVLLTAGDLAATAVELMFRTASSSAARRGQRMQRYFRDVAMYRGHLASQRLDIALDAGRLYLGVPGRFSQRLAVS